METQLRGKNLLWVEEALRQHGLLRQSELFGHDKDHWLGAAIDSRGECSNRIFFALKANNGDGHEYTEEARSKGSCAVVVDREDTVDRLKESETPFVLVNDSLAALQELSREYRKALSLRVVAVTGSAGKTTTKEYIRLILRKKYKVSSNPGNFNNHIGVPLTLLDTDHESEYLVSEVAANHTGEIAFLAGILDPDIGVITNVGDAHIGLFGSREKIAEAKAELLEAMDRDGCAVLPGEDDFFELLNDRAQCRVVTFGYGERCAVRLSSVQQSADRIDFTVNGQVFAIKSFGLYNVLNAAAAFAVGELCGVEAERIREALADALPIRGRAQIQRSGGIVLVDDSYNANPTSMRAALDSLANISGSRRIAVLGDMAELGSYTDQAHNEIGSYIAQSCVDRVYWLGTGGDQVGLGIRSASGKQDFQRYDALDELVAALEKDIKSGDVILVKASRAARLDEVVEHLQATRLKKDGN